MDCTWVDGSACLRPSCGGSAWAEAGLDRGAPAHAAEASAAEASGSSEQSLQVVQVLARSKVPRDVAHQDSQSPPKSPGTLPQAGLGERENPGG